VAEAGVNTGAHGFRACPAPLPRVGSALRAHRRRDPLSKCLAFGTSLGVEIHESITLVRRYPAPGNGPAPSPTAGPFLASLWRTGYTVRPCAESRPLHNRGSARRRRSRRNVRGEVPAALGSGQDGFEQTPSQARVRSDSGCGILQCDEDQNGETQDYQTHK